ELHLGPIDDYDDAWVNGRHVGSEHRSGQWQQARTYAIPRGVLRAGRNVIAVRVLDTGGLGGINGNASQLRLTAGATTVDLAGTWQFARGEAMSQIGSLPAGVNFGPNTATVLFNGMIAPLTPYTIRGAIWYQGESNRTRAEQYRRLFPAMITDWRRQWGIGDFPFYYVQIAPFRYGGDTGQAAALREAQMMTLSVPNTGMAVTMDIGNPADIHPKNKHDVGHRLALLARRHTYGERGLAASGPLYRDHAVEGNAIRLRFDHTDGGLELRQSRKRVFWIAGDDRRFAPADARVVGDSVVVTCAGVARPVAVRYAWEAAAEGTLFNGAGLPASSFRTDDWEGPLPPVTNEAEARSYRTDEPGFVPLFNERDLTGWVNVNGAPSTWNVQDGVIACSGIPTGVLRTEMQYENFILELEWRHLRAGGNAGVFVWSDPLPAKGQPYTRGIEVQVLDGQEGSWYTSDGDIFPIHGARMTPENGRGGSRAFPTEARSNAAPLWNHYRIEGKDGSITLAVNGTVVTRGHDASPRKGYICLESEGSPVEFRRILIKPLPSSDGLSADAVADEARGFRSLYSGVDFDGWKYTPEHAGHWTAANWKIAFDGVGPDLWTEESFGDFELRCDWRWAGEAVEGERPVVLPNGDQPGTTVRVMDAGDSGIYLRGSSKSQVNIWCWPIGSGEVYGYRTDRSMPADVRAGVTPRVAADAPIGEWNRFEITMVGEELTVVLNGQTVLDHARLPGVAARGPIALQRHGAPIEFANVFIRTLD
ncbi:MAG: DUF1080 domain-containing protein, partial [Phycisphaerae bacterium]|nr:DUF1080 domain-containing protein [Phycisphaerae bacterium]